MSLVSSENLFKAPLTVGLLRI